MSDTAAKWAKRVAAWRKSGLTSVEFCAGHEFSAGGLRHWAYRLAHEPQRASTIRIARVLRAPREAGLVLPGRGASSCTTVDAAVPTGDPVVAIELGSARVFVGRGVDHATLATVVDVLGPRVGTR